MATTAEVERAIRTLQKNLAKAAPEPDAIPNRSLLCVIPDLDIAFWGEFRDSRLEDLRKADREEKSDVRLTAKSDDLIALIEGKLGISSAFLLGRVRIDASPVDLMRLRRLF